MNMKKLQIYADGGSRNNPGDAACGFVVIDGESGEIIAEVGKYLGIATNNVAEWNGLIEGLKYVKENFDLGTINAEVFLDSELVVKQINGIYKVKQDHLKPLHASVVELIKTIGSVSVNHVFRAENKIADKIVNDTLDNYLNKK
jgi:ribonuclease HI